MNPLVLGMTPAAVPTIEQSSLEKEPLLPWIQLTPPHRPGTAAPSKVVSPVQWTGRYREDDMAGLITGTKRMVWPVEWP